MFYGDHKRDKGYSGKHNISLRCLCLAKAVEPCIAGSGGGVRKMRVLARVASRRVGRNIHIYMLPLLLLLC